MQRGDQRDDRRDEPTTAELERVLLRMFRPRKAQAIAQEIAENHLNGPQALDRERTPEWEQ